MSDLAIQDSLSRRLADRLGLDPDLVLLDLRKVGNPLYRDPALPVVSQIILIDDDGRDQPLEDVEGSLSQKVRVEDEAKLYLYVPADEASQEERAQMGRDVEAELAAAAEEARA